MHPIVWQAVSDAAPRADMAERPLDNTISKKCCNELFQMMKCTRRASI
jgi:hypothetical protein